MKKQEFTVPLGVGISSMVAIFVTVTLTILSVLALQSTYTYRQSIIKQAAYMKDYYRADNKGERIIKEMHQMIQSNTYSNLVEAIQKNQSLKSYETINKKENGNFNIMYKIPLNGKQDLYITIELAEGKLKKDKIHYQIVEWQVITNSKKMGWEIENR